MAWPRRRLYFTSAAGVADMSRVRHLKRRYQIGDADQEASCKTTVTRSSATLIEMTQTCTGGAAGTREARIEAPTPTTMKMVSKSTSGRGAGTTVNMNGKWLGADCGDEK